MSIHFISGKPGGGKSLYSVKLIVEELIHGERVIITNVALKLPELNDYLQVKYPSKAIDLFKRVILLNDDDTGKFWTIRPDPSKGPVVLTKEQWEKRQRPDYSNCADNGVFYAIDEVHNYFNARAWMETGRDVLFYLSQHRKLGDTVICITQHIGNVDKQFRSVAQDYTYLRNLKKEKQGLFTLPALFLRRTYGEPATPTSQAMETGTFKLDVTGLAACYDTAKGVSIHGKGGDIAEKRKGVPWYIIAIAVPIIAIVLFKTIPGAFANMWMKAPNAAVQKIQKPTTNYVDAISNPIQQVTHRNNETTIKVAQWPKTVCCTGYDTLTGVYRVFLSTGEMFKQGDGKLEEIGETYVIIQGQRLPICRL